MGSLFITLHTAAESLQVFQRALGVTSNNVTNANTPGYAKQRLDLVAKRFELETGFAGGVAGGSMLSAREQYLERAVRSEASQQRYYAQAGAALAQVEPAFGIGDGAGIAAAMGRLFQSFSHWAVNPNDGTSREMVLRSAEDVARAFRTTAVSLDNAGRDIDNQIRDTVEAINALGQKLQGFNVALRQYRRSLDDAGLDAEIHSALEELSGHVDLTVLRGEDGSFSVFLGGQAPLVLGDKFFPIQADFSGGMPVIRDTQGRDISDQMQQGGLAGLLRVRRQDLPAFQADLDLLATTLADRINQTLASGLDQTGAAPVKNLFTYDATYGVARTLAISDLTPQELAGALPSAPGGNGNALNLAELVLSPEINGATFTEYYGQLAGRVGRQLDQARQEERTHSVMLAQARTLRAEREAVSLDEEAAALMAFQRSYEATAQLFRALDELTRTTIGLLR